MTKPCPRCGSGDVVKIGKFNPDDNVMMKCLDCDEEFE